MFREGASVVNPKQVLKFVKNYIVYQGIVRFTFFSAIPAIVFAIYAAARAFDVPVTEIFEAIQTGTKEEYTQAGLNFGSSWAINFCINAAFFVISTQMAKDIYIGWKRGVVSNARFGFVISAATIASTMSGIQGYLPFQFEKLKIKLFGILITFSGAASNLITRPVAANKVCELTQRIVNGDDWRHQWDGYYLKQWQFTGNSEITAVSGSTKEEALKSFIREHRRQVKILLDDINNFFLNIDSGEISSERLGNTIIFKRGNKQVGTHEKLTISQKGFISHSYDIHSVQRIERDQLQSLETTTCTYTGTLPLEISKILSRYVFGTLCAGSAFLVWPGFANISANMQIGRFRPFDHPLTAPLNLFLAIFHWIYYSYMMFFTVPRIINFYRHDIGNRFNVNGRRMRDYFRSRQYRLVPEEAQGAPVSNRVSVLREKSFINDVVFPIGSIFFWLLISILLPVIAYYSGSSVREIMFEGVAQNGTNTFRWFGITPDDFVGENADVYGLIVGMIINFITGVMLFKLDTKAGTEDKFKLENNRYTSNPVVYLSDVRNLEALKLLERSENTGVTYTKNEREERSNDWKEINTNTASLIELYKTNRSPVTAENVIVPQEPIERTYSTNELPVDDASSRENSNASSRENSM